MNDNFMPLTLLDRFWAWVREWQDGLIWIPVASALFLLSWWILPIVDPRSGIDGLGALNGYALLLLKGVLSVFMAWLCKRTYTRDVPENVEAATDVAVAHSKGWQWLAARLLDRLEWMAWIGFWFYCLSH